MVELDEQLVTEKLDAILSGTLINRKLHNSLDVQEFLDELYVNGLTTPEQCAKKIQGRADILLHE